MNERCHFGKDNHEFNHYFIKNLIQNRKFYFSYNFISKRVLKYNIFLINLYLFFRGQVR